MGLSFECARCGTPLTIRRGELVCPNCTPDIKAHYRQWESGFTNKGYGTIKELEEPNNTVQLELNLEYLYQMEGFNK